MATFLKGNPPPQCICTLYAQSDSFLMGLPLVEPYSQSRTATVPDRAMTIYKMYPRQQFNACNVLLNVFPYLCILCTIWPKNCLISQSDGVIRIDKPIFIAHTTYSILRSRTCSSDWVRAKVAGVQKGDGKNDKSISALSLHDLDQELLPLPNEIIWRWKVSHVY